MAHDDGYIVASHLAGWGSIIVKMNSMQSAEHRRSCEGFTLLEMVFIISIISILSLTLLNGLPLARDNQIIAADRAWFQSIVRTAQLRAVNELRDEACMAQAGGSPEIERRCSDVGLLLQGRRILMFSDLDGDQAYAKSVDYDIQEFTATSKFEPDGKVIIFESVPPLLRLYDDGSVIAPTGNVALTMSVGSLQRNVRVTFYGNVE